MRPMSFRNLDVAVNPAPAAPVESPCVKTCVIDDDDGLCVGCSRTLDEIAGWGGYSPAKRRAIMDVLEARRSAPHESI